MNRELRRGTPVDRMMAAAEGRRSDETQVASNEVPNPHSLVLTDVPSASGAHESPDYFVQVGSFADPDNAERVREELADSGPIDVQEYTGSYGPLYRVRIGPLKNEAQAQLALRQAVDLGHPDARLVMAHAAL
jgi:cell division protein FtsN